MKPINEAFPVEIPYTESDEALLQEYRARLEFALLESEDCMLREHVDQKVTHDKTPVEDIVAQLTQTVPIDILEAILRLLERIPEENDALTVEKALRKATEVFTDEMIPAFVFLGLGQGGYLRRYQRSCNNKKRQTCDLLYQEMAQLFDHIVEDTQKERDFALAMQDGSVRELWERTSTYEKDRLLRREKRLGRKNSLYVYIKAERGATTDFNAGHWLDQNVRTQAYFDPREDVSSNALESDSSNAWGQDGISEEDLAAVGVDIDDSSLPDNKIFVGNLPKGVGGADVAHALRNCGDIAKVWFFNTEDTEGSMEKPASAGASVLDNADNAREINAETGIESDAETVQVQKGHEQFVEKGIYLANGGVEVHMNDLSIEESRSSHNSTMQSASAGPSTPAPQERSRGRSNNELGIETGEIELDGHESSTLFDAVPPLDAVDSMMEATEEDLEEEFATVLASVGEEGDDEDQEGGMSELDAKTIEAEEPDLRVAVAEVRQLGHDDLEFKKKSKALKKRIMRMQRGYNYAYVQMEESKGYYNATRDEMRIFGICIKGYNCRVQEAWRLRTLVVEMVSPMKCLKIRHSLGAHLGSWYNFNYYKGVDLVSSDDEAKVLDQEKPIFVHLEFRSHQEAWKAFDLLDNAYNSGASDLKVSWIKGEWYWKVAKKARDLSFTMSPSRAKKEAKSLEAEVEKLSDGNSDKK